MSKLAGKVIIVTGAGSGIGLATTKALAAEGASVAIFDIHSASAQSLAEHLGGPHRPYALDVGSSQQCRNWIDSVVSDFGHIDGLFNCAGINPTEQPLVETTDEYWDKLINTNLRGPYNVTKACIPHLHAGASIVNVSSTAGIRASAGFAIYNASKFGIIGFSKSMAMELGAKGIRVNVVAPGPIDTPTNASVVEGRSRSRGLKRGLRWAGWGNSRRWRIRWCSCLERE